MHYKKFTNLKITSDGSPRAKVSLKNLTTLWFNTGTLCNISCKGCYIESSPKNKELQYLDLSDIKKYINEIRTLNLNTKLIGFTGGEPFLNPNIISMLNYVLENNFKVLLLTNAMKPMLNKARELKNISKKHNLQVRVSIDHYQKKEHEDIRGEKTWDPLIKGLLWLNENKFSLSLASRFSNSTNENDIRNKFKELIKKLGLKIDSFNKESLLLFPDMNIKEDIPEISEKCWSVLKKDPSSVMCSDSRMVVKRKNSKVPVILSCTLITKDKDFELGTDIKNSNKITYLKHPYCSQFCVLGNSSCSN